MTATKTDYEMVIGLEVHAQLKTNTKLFCNCSTEFGKDPNENTCPVCMGFPGTLPVLNDKAVEYAIKAGLALDCEIDPNCKFDRKQYFYPDLPKGYQISQYDKPLCLGGKLVINYEDDDKKLQSKEIGITRIHMEEDAGKLVHAGGGADDASIEADRLFGSDYSLADWNRACTPLIEIVSEPDIRSAAEAVAYVKELRKTLLYLDVTDGNMQEGSLRCDVNISIRKPGEEFGTRAEIKNVNSFRSIFRAIEFEYKRQSKLLDSGEKVVQETRLFEEGSGKTHSMRSKEEASDYRYFPEPDLVPLGVPQDLISKLEASLPELPSAKKTRYMEEFQISDEAASVITEEIATADFFEEVLAANQEGDAKALAKRAKKVANWIIGSIAAYLNENKQGITDTKLTAGMLAEMVSHIEKGTISDNIAKNDIINELLANGDQYKSVEEFIEKKGLAQITDTSEVESIIQGILDNNQKQVEDFKAGNQKIRGFFVGQVMKATQGKASPQLVNQLLDKLLSA